MTDLARKKELEGGQERNRTHRSTVNGTWVSTVPHILNRMELSQEELQDNLRLRHGLMPQEIPATCDGCSLRLLMEHALSCPKGGLVMARHDDTTKEWNALGDRALVPSAITYEPKVNSRTVEGGRT